jgi:hypothetical protein
MTNLPIPTPDENISSEPDKYTKKSPDMTGEHAENRIFFFNCRVFRFGTDDKAYAGALILSVIIMTAILFVCVLMAFSDNEGLKSIAGLLVTAFTGTSGYAVGRATSSPKELVSD